MSNMTKTIAILGVVAGLGVAALPLSTYAADVTVSDPDKVVDGTVPDTAADGSVSQAVGINLTVEKVLSIDASADNVNLNKANSYIGPALTVNVITNNSEGYKLNIAGTGTGAGANGKTALTGNDANSTEILTFGTNLASTALADLTAAANTSVWGYTATGGDVNAKFTNGTMYAGVTEDGETIATKNVPTADTGSETSVTFKAIVDNAQPAGTYKGQVTFTATDL